MELFVVQKIAVFVWISEVKIINEVEALCSTIGVINHPKGLN
jgi:hypothetical protein